MEVHASSHPAEVGLMKQAEKVTGEAVKDVVESSSDQAKEAQAIARASDEGRGESLNARA